MTLPMITLELRSCIPLIQSFQNAWISDHSLHVLPHSYDLCSVSTNGWNNPLSPLWLHEHQWIQRIQTLTIKHFGVSICIPGLMHISNWLISCGFRGEASSSHDGHKGFIILICQVLCLLSDEQPKCLALLHKFIVDPTWFQTWCDLLCHILVSISTPSYPQGSDNFLWRTQTIFGLLVMVFIDIHALIVFILIQGCRKVKWRSGGMIFCVIIAGKMLFLEMFHSTVMSLIHWPATLITRTFLYNST